MTNSQPISPISHSNGERVLVHSIFETIQGEGPFAGRRALFVRLAGCNLQCPGCDTEYTEGAKEYHFEDLACDVSSYFSPGDDGLVVITGGEPFRQNIAPFCKQIIAQGAHEDQNLHVQIETNGRIQPQYPDIINRLQDRRKLTIVVAPKTAHTAAFFEIGADAWKYVVSAGDVWKDGLPIRALGHPVKNAGRGGYIARPPAGYEGDIFIQPFDSGNEEENKLHLQEALRCVTDYPGRRRISLQVHKLLGME